MMGGPPARKKYARPPKLVCPPPVSEIVPPPQQEGHLCKDSISTLGMSMMGDDPPCLLKESSCNIEKEECLGDDAQLDAWPKIHRESPSDYKAQHSPVPKIVVFQHGGISDDTDSISTLGMGMLMGDPTCLLGDSSCVWNTKKKGWMGPPSQQVDSQHDILTTADDLPTPVKGILSQPYPEKIVRGVQVQNLADFTWVEQFFYHEVSEDAQQQGWLSPRKRKRPQYVKAKMYYCLELQTWMFLTPPPGARKVIWYEEVLTFLIQLPKPPLGCLYHQGHPVLQKVGNQWTWVYEEGGFWKKLMRSYTGVEI